MLVVVLASFWSGPLHTSWAAQPVEGPPFQETTGWHTIYLTHDRLCKDCKMRDLGNERVLLWNQQGDTQTCLSFEVVGVDYHPIQRKLLRTMLGNIGTVVGRPIVPDFYPENGHVPYYNEGITTSDW